MVRMGLAQAASLWESPGPPVDLTGQQWNVHPKVPM